MAKTLRTSGDYTIKAGDGFNSGSGTNTITLDSLNVSVSGNLTVGGTSSTISTTNTVIEDNIIELQTGISASSNDSGIIIERGSTGDNAAIIWDESVDSFKLGTTTATGADKSGGITVTAGALEVAALTATTGTFSGALTSVGFTVQGNLTAGSVTTNEISANGSNADLSIQPSGTGDVLISALRVNGTTIDSSDSSAVQINENTEVDGTLTVTGAVTITSGTITGITDLAVADGGTGASSLTDNAVLTGTGTSAITAEGNLSFNGSTLAVTGAATVSTTLGVTGATTLSGGATILGTTTTGSLQTNEIAANGSNAAVTVTSSGTGDITLDAGGDIILDADNADIKLQDGGTEFGRISRITSDLVIKSMGDNKDIILKGLDSSATINALTLDMSEAGAATFNSTVTATDITANSLTTNVISSNGSNADLSIQPSGTGDVLISALRINGTTLDSSDSTKVTIAEALDVTGAVTANAGVVVDNITIDGTEIDLSSGDLTLDVAGDILLDAGGNDVKIVNGGTELTRFTNNSQNLILKNPNQNKDITISGNDGGSNVDALVFDMSEAGAATFNSTVTATDITANSLTTNAISSNGSNAELSLQASGTGDVVISALRVNGTTLDSADSTKVTIAEAVDVTGTLFSRGNVFGVQTLTGSGSTGVVNLTDTVTLLVTTGGSQAFSLADGVEGQIKIISMKTDGGSGVVTPANFVNGTNITFDDVEDTVTLLYQSTGWVALARQNATFG